MKILDLAQGTPEWHETRAKYPTASEAPAMMGASKYQSRNDLIKQKATGITAEVSSYQQKIFDKGHNAEALARPFAEVIIGDELFPATGLADDESMLASFDGVTMMEDVCWEHKLWNNSLAAAINDDEIEPHYYWQMEQQLLVSGADKCLFMCSDGTEENMAHTWYKPVPGRREALIAGWLQFNKDVGEYTPETLAEIVIAEQQEDLPVVLVDLVGEVRSSNLAAVEQVVLARIKSINTNLTTDKDFADAEATVKFFTKGEKQLEEVKNQALAQTASIDELFKTVDRLKSEMRDKRLKLNKSVKERKEALKASIVMQAKESLSAHVNELNKQLGEHYSLPMIPNDFGLAIKGKKSLNGIQSAADDELASAKITATQYAKSIAENAVIIVKLSAGFEHLFTDRNELVMLSADHLADKIKSRIAHFLEGERIRKASEEARASQQAALKAQAEKIAPTQDAPVVTQPRFVPPVKPTKAAAEEVITISLAEYNQLQKDSDLLDALIASGVDNWSGYSDAIEMIKAA